MPTFRNILEDLKVVNMLDADEYAAAENVGDIIDRKGYDQLVILTGIGQGVDTKTLIGVLFDDTVVGMGGEASFATIETQTANTDEDKVHVATINLAGANRYVRIKGTNNDTMDFYYVGLLGRTNALLLPVTQENTVLGVTYS